jgi:hypothetical protein
MSDSGSETTLTIPFTAEQIEAIDAWIARSAEPKPSREEAVRQLIVGRLGADGHQSTVIPGMVTGRDIV